MLRLEKGKKEIGMVNKIIILLCLLCINDALAGSTPPPSVWSPDYQVKILFIIDDTANIGEDLKKYTDQKISSLNSTLKKSHVNLKAKSVGYARLQGVTFKSLYDFRRHPTVGRLKKEKGADIVFVFSDLDFSWTVCGRGYRTQSNRSAYSAGRAGHWLCGATDTFIHEVGHNLGLAHNKSVSGKLAPYAAGHGNWAWVTVMGYPGTHGGLITKDRFSNPNIKCDALYACGDSSDADAVRYINSGAGMRFSKL